MTKFILMVEQYHHTTGLGVELLTNLIILNNRTHSTVNKNEIFVYLKTLLIVELYRKNKKILIRYTAGP